MARDALPRFLAAMVAAGLHPRESIAGRLVTGQLVRFCAQGDAPDQPNGWAVLQLDQAIPTGAFGHYRLGIHESWRGDRSEQLAPQLRRLRAQDWREVQRLGITAEQAHRQSPASAR